MGLSDSARLLCVHQPVDGRGGTVEMPDPPLTVGGRANGLCQIGEVMTEFVRHGRKGGWITEANEPRRRPGRSFLTLPLQHLLFTGLGDRVKPRWHAIASLSTSSAVKADLRSGDLEFARQGGYEGFRCSAVESQPAEPVDQVPVRTEPSHRVIVPTAVWRRCQMLKSHREHHDILAAGSALSAAGLAPSRERPTVTPPERERR